MPYDQPPFNKLHHTKIKFIQWMLPYCADFKFHVKGVKNEKGHGHYEETTRTHLANVMTDPDSIPFEFFEMNKVFPPVDDKMEYTVGIANRKALDKPMWFTFIAPKKKLLEVEKRRLENI